MSFGPETSLSIVLAEAMVLARAGVVPGTVTAAALYTGISLMTGLPLALNSMRPGSVRVLGTQLAGASKPTRIILRRRFGFTFQTHNLHKSLKALQNERMGLDVHGPVPGAVNAAAPVLRFLGPGECLDYKQSPFSGEQRPPVAVVRARG